MHIQLHSKRYDISCLIKMAAIFLFVYALPFIAMGSTNQDLGDIADNITGTFSKLVGLVIAVSYIAGIGFAVAGIMKFKQHQDNPTQVPLSGPITMVFIAAALVWLPSVLGTIGQTVFDDSDGSQAGNAQGDTDLFGRSVN